MSDKQETPKCPWCGAVLTTKPCPVLGGFIPFCPNLAKCPTYQQYDTESEALAAAQLRPALRYANEALSLLAAAQCPCCDGSGAYYDSNSIDQEPEVCQCQWCDETKALLAKTKEVNDG